MKNFSMVSLSTSASKGFLEIESPGKIILQNSGLVVRMVKFFVPCSTFTHDLGIKFGSSSFPAYSTLSEMREFYPEPIEYFIFKATATKNMEILEK